MQVIPDPTTVHFHLPSNLSVRVHREYDDFITELINNFPHEKDGILGFYNECWKVRANAPLMTSLSRASVFAHTEAYGYCICRSSMLWILWSWSHWRSQSTSLDSSLRSPRSALLLVNICNMFCKWRKFDEIFYPLRQSKDYECQCITTRLYKFYSNIYEIKCLISFFKLCPSLAYYLPQNAGEIARKHIKDPQLLSFIDAEVWMLLFLSRICKLVLLLLAEHAFVNFLFSFAVFYCQHSQCSANTNDKCKHGIW